jgi:hypothetical protein
LDRQLTQALADRRRDAEPSAGRLDLRSLEAAPEVLVVIMPEIS